MKIPLLTKIQLKSLLRNFCVMLLLFACSEDLPEQNSDKKLSQTEVLEYIKSLGFSDSSIEEFDDYYLVEGDISFTKKKPYPKNGRSNQAYVTTGLVNYFEITDVTVTVDATIPTIGEDDWRNEVEQAVNDWNSIGGSRIHFVYTTGLTADVVIRSDGGALRGNVIAQAEAPSSGGIAGFQVRVNLDFNSNLSVPTAQKRYNMVHELGHTIGLRHTNWASLSSEVNTLANHIPGTPCSDNNSVMNGGTADFSWTGFSDYDRLAGQILYPPDRPSGVFYFLRYYQQSTGDHFYTIYYGELGCGAGGYVAEGVEGFIFQNQASGTVPIYRYFSTANDDHFYTLTSGSYSTYSLESIAGYAYNTPTAGTIPIHVYYNSSLQDHFYTKINSTYPGYVYQGVAWYAFP